MLLGSPCQDCPNLMSIDELLEGVARRALRRELLLQSAVPRVLHRSLLLQSAEQSNRVLLEGVARRVLRRGLLLQGAVPVVLRRGLLLLSARGSAPERVKCRPCRTTATRAMCTVSVKLSQRCCPERKPDCFWQALESSNA